MKRISIKELSFGSIRQKYSLNILLVSLEKEQDIK